MDEKEQKVKIRKMSLVSLDVTKNYAKSFMIPTPCALETEFAFTVLSTTQH